jgi:hypothetical protein
MGITSPERVSAVVGIALERFPIRAVRFVARRKGGKRSRREFVRNIAPRTEMSAALFLF